MANLIILDRVILKNNPDIKEDAIQSFIFSNPSVLGLGDLISLQRERIQLAGGRLDLLLGDDNGARYEVEIQLGATDPNHIIRTLEYWDRERKRYPQYDHCAVIVAEEITGRFMNIISLFNGTIPLIAIQMSAYKIGEDILLTFTKVLDRNLPTSDDEEAYEVTDRKYWESRSTPKMLKNVDAIFKSLGELVEGYEFNYTKFYVGLAKDGASKNFIAFYPKKNYLWFVVKGTDDPEKVKRIEDAGLELNHILRWKQYRIRLNGVDDYKKNKELIDKLVAESKEYFSIE